MNMKKLIISLGVFIFSYSTSLTIAQAEVLSCDKALAMKSAEGGQEVTISITNKTTESRTGMWVDYEGKLIEYFTLKPGQTKRQQTLTTHPWVFVDKSGKCVEGLMPSATDLKYELKVSKINSKPSTAAKKFVKAKIVADCGKVMVTFEQNDNFDVYMGKKFIESFNANSKRFNCVDAKKSKYELSPFP
jgi:hypothetical protein